MFQSTIQKNFISYSIKTDNKEDFNSIASMCSSISILIIGLTIIDTFLSIPPKRLNIWRTYWCGMCQDKYHHKILSFNFYIFTIQAKWWYICGIDDRNMRRICWIYFARLYRVHFYGKYCSFQFQLSYICIDSTQISI